MIQRTEKEALNYCSEVLKQLTLITYSAAAHVWNDTMVTIVGIVLRPIGQIDKTICNKIYSI